MAVPSLPKSRVVSRYPRSQLPEIVGLTGRQIKRLAERGLITPSARGSSGRGRTTFYSWDDLLVMATLARVTKIGRSDLLSEDLTKTVVEVMRNPDLDPIVYQCLVFEDSSVFIVEDVKKIFGSLEAGDPMLLVPLRPVEDELRRRLVRAGGDPGPRSEERQRAA